MAEFIEHGSYTDAVEGGRKLRVGVCNGTVQLRIEGGRPEFRDSFLMCSEQVHDFVRDIEEALDEVEALYEEE